MFVHLITCFILFVSIRSAHETGSLTDVTSSHRWWAAAFCPTKPSWLTLSSAWTKTPCCPPQRFVLPVLVSAGHSAGVCLWIWLSGMKTVDVDLTPAHKKDWLEEVTSASFWVTTEMFQAFRVFLMTLGLFPGAFGTAPWEARCWIWIADCTKDWDGTE